MAARATIWCKKPVTIGLAELYRELASIDWYTLGEGWGLDEDAVEEALGGLAIAGEGLDDAEVRWGPGRPLQIRSITGADLEEMRAEQDKVPASATEAVSSAVQGWDLELGWSQIEGFGGALAFVVAFALAESGDGVIDFYGEQWFAAADRSTPLK